MFRNTLERLKMYLRPVPIGQLLIHQHFNAPFQHTDVRVPEKHTGDVSIFIQTICKPPSTCLGNSTTSRLPRACPRHAEHFGKGSPQPQDTRYYEYGTIFPGWRPVVMIKSFALHWVTPARPKATQPSLHLPFP